MPGGFKDRPVTSTNDSLHGTSSTVDSTPIASSMRSSNVINPHGSAYEVAGPSMGGSPAFHNRALDAVKDQTLPEPVAPVSSSGTPAHTLADTVKDGATAAASGAAAAGASVIAAAKGLINRRNENEFGNPHVDTTPHPITNRSNSPSDITTSKTSSLGSSSPTLSQPKPLGPHDRPPIRVAIHAQKPSDKATYGNLDSPGAHSHPGPLSDRALASTPPPSVLPLPRTIADPFGPVVVTNWNDGKRPVDELTPTSEDFDSPRMGPMRDHPEKSFTAPGSAPSQQTKRMHNPSPLREEVPAIKKASAIATDVKHPTPNKAEYFPQVHHSSTMTTPHSHNNEPLGERIKDVFHHHNSPTTASALHNNEPLGERIKDVFHHESHPTVEVPIKVNTSTIAATSAAPEIFTNKTEYVPVENLKDIDVSKIAERASHQLPSTTTTRVTSTETTTAPFIKPLAVHTSTTTPYKETLGERVKEALHFEPHPTVEVPIKVNTSTIATSSAAPEVFTNKTEYVPVENLKDIDVSKVAQAASHQPAALGSTTKTTVTETTTTKPVAHKESIVDRVKEVFHHEPSAPATVHHKTEHVPTVVEKHHEPIIAATSTTAPSYPARSVVNPTYSTSTTEKESLVDRVKDVFRRDTPETVTERTHVTSKTAAPVTIAAATGTAAGVAAFLNDKDTDNTTTPPKAHDHRAYLAPGAKSSIASTTEHSAPAAAVSIAPETHSHVFKPVDASPLKKHTVAPAPVFDTRYMNTPAHAPITTTAASTTTPVVPVVHTTTTDPTTLHPVTETRTRQIPPSDDHRSVATKIKDTLVHHSASEYGPADPKDLHLTNPKTLHAINDIAPIAAATTAAAAVPLVNKTTTTTTSTTNTHTPVVPVAQTVATPAVAAKPVNEIQFTDPTTLRPLTGTRTWQVPPPGDHRSITTKAKDVLTFHSDSEYGPADPKDLPLSDPKTLRLLKDIAPVAATAAAVAPLIQKSTTTTTATSAPTVVKEEHNPVLTAPRPVIPVPSVSKTEVNPVLNASHPVIPPTSSIKTESNTLQTAPRPVIPPTSHVESHTVKEVPHPVIPPVVTEKTHHQHVESNPVQTAPRPVIPPTTHVESHTVKEASHPVIPPVVTEKTHHQHVESVQTAPRPVIPVVPTIEKTTTTTHQNIPVSTQATSASRPIINEKTVPVVAPVVAAAAAVPIVANSRSTTATTTYDNTPNVVQSAPRPVIPAVTAAPVVQQQQFQQVQQPTSYSSTTTNSYNTAPVPQQQVITNRVSAAEVDVADKIAAAIPESYHGPIPNLQPGEEIVWVKTVTTTDFYDDNSPVASNVNLVGGPGNNVNPALGVPANTMHDNSSQRRHSGGFLDRLTHRQHDNVDKGKQRM
ncbi:hypothetical protein EC991_007012 [Linnemannia zychae]|nr:hypothetical protein EC991_007012 [Linnemannia zychae]